MTEFEFWSELCL